MNASSTLVSALLGITEAVAAYGDHLDSVEGQRLAVAARVAIDRFWDETADYPPAARAYRDEVFTLLLNTQSVSLP